MSSFKSQAKKILQDVGLHDPVYWVYRRAAPLSWRTFGMASGRERRIFEDYIKTHKTRRLHMGCGSNDLPGWLNTDLNPSARRIHLDVTKTFPYPSNTFDFAFSEHMIEHIPYADGKKMITECFRVLKPGGVLRLVTPDFKFVMKLYQDSQKDIHKDYIAWNADMFIGDRAPHDAISVVNNFVRDWGHEYIYDADALCGALKNVGFEDVKTAELQKSEHPDLCNLENAQRQPDGFLKLESLIVEARKPAR